MVIYARFLSAVNFSHDQSSKWAHVCCPTDPPQPMITRPTMTELMSDAMLDTAAPAMKMTMCTRWTNRKSNKQVTLRANDRKAKLAREYDSPIQGKSFIFPKASYIIG